jgi:carbonic anhydrase/acetyltransferase-like protein (isoleucine patch superfamily)
MAIYQLDEFRPAIAASAFVAESAILIGKVVIGERASIWPGAVLRGDNEPIEIGDECNVQDGAVLHTDPGMPMVIGKRVSIAHQVMLHGCTIGAGSLIGIHAVVMNKVVIGQNCLVGAGTLVPEGKSFPDRTLILGTPGKVVRELGEKDLAMLSHNADVYVRRRQRYLDGLKRIG